MPILDKALSKHKSSMDLKKLDKKIKAKEQEIANVTAEYQDNLQSSNYLGFTRSDFVQLEEFRIKILKNELKRLIDKFDDLINYDD